MRFDFFRTINYSLIVFFLLTIIFLIHLMPMGWNDASRLATVQSLVEQKSFQIDNSEWFLNYTGDKVYINGHFYSDKPLVHAVLASVPYSLLYPLGLTIKHHPQIVFFITTVFISLLPSLLFFYLFYKWSVNKWLEQSQNRKLFLIFCLAIGTILLPYTTVVNNHITSAALVGIVFLILYYKPLNKPNLFLVGLLLALGTVMDPGVIFILGWFGLYILYKVFSNHSQLIKFRIMNVVCLALGALIIFGLHTVITVPIIGDIFPGSMHSEYFDYPNSPFDSQNLTGDGLAVSSFKDWLKYLYAMLFSQMRGFVLHNPILWLGFPLLVYLLIVKKDKLLYLATILSIVSVVLYYSLFGKDFGGPNYSIRWFIIFIPLVLIAIYNWIDNWKKYLVVVVLCLIALVSNIAATSKVFNYANSGSTDKRLFVRALQAFPTYANSQTEQWIKIIKK